MEFRTSFWRNATREIGFFYAYLLPTPNEFGGRGVPGNTQYQGPGPEQVRSATPTPN
jgi:hypothetical protein